MSSKLKLYVEEWRRFMMGEKISEAAKALGLTIGEYEELEEYPFRLTAEQLSILATAIGVLPSQFFFPVKPEHLTPAQKRTPAGAKLLKLVSDRSRS
jgi:hypothetical protein